MITRLSEYSNNDVAKLVESLKNKVNTDYNKRSVIDKRYLRDELSKIDMIPFIHNKLMELRKEDERYDVIISIAYKGYVKFALHFPITQKQYVIVMNEYEVKKEIYGYCVRRCETFYDVLHDYVENKFNWIDMELQKSYQSYIMSDENRYVRELEFTRIKRY